MKKLALLAGFALVSLASSARADDTSLPARLTLHEYIVYGRAPRPQVVIEVPKVTATVAANQAHQSMMQRIEAAAHAAPF